MIFAEGDKNNIKPLIYLFFINFTEMYDDVQKTKEQTR